MSRPPCPCGRPFKARGLCASHYRMALRGSEKWAALLSPNKAPGAKWVNLCDEPECFVYGLPSLVAPKGQGTHYCPDHYPMSRCRVCNRYIRPDRTPALLWPETVSIGTHGRCHSCTLAMFEKIEVEPLAGYDVERVKGLVDKLIDGDHAKRQVLATLGIKED